MELISLSEFARRVGKSRQYISKNKNTKLQPAIVDDKIDFEIGLKIINKSSHDANPIQKINKIKIEKTKSNQKKDSIKKIEDSTTTKDIQVRIEDEPLKKQQDEQKKITKKEMKEKVKEELGQEEDAKELLEQILTTIKDTNAGFAELQNLKMKAEILKTYFNSKKEETAHELMKGNLFDREQLQKIYSYAVNNIRNTLINMGNNYAVSLEGLNKKQIKEYVDADVNQILEDFQNSKKQWDLSK